MRGIVIRRRRITTCGTSHRSPTGFCSGGGEGVKRKEFAGSTTDAIDLWSCKPIDRLRMLTVQIIAYLKAGQKQ